MDAHEPSEPAPLDPEVVAQVNFRVVIELDNDADRHFLEGEVPVLKRQLILDEVAWLYSGFDIEIDSLQLLDSHFLERNFFLLFLLFLLFFTAVDAKAIEVLVVPRGAVVAWITHPWHVKHARLPVVTYSGLFVVTVVSLPGD